MPTTKYESDQQRKYLWAKKPKVARQCADKHKSKTRKGKRGTRKK